MDAVLEGLLISSVVVVDDVRPRRPVGAAPRATTAAHRTRGALRGADRASSCRRDRPLGSTAACGASRRRRSSRAGSTLPSPTWPTSSSPRRWPSSPRVLAVAGAGRAGSVVRRDLAARIDELEAVGRRLTTLAAQASRAAGDGSANRVRERLAALEAARAELAEIDRASAGLIRHA